MTFSSPWHENRTFWIILARLGIFWREFVHLGKEKFIFFPRPNTSPPLRDLSSTLFTTDPEKHQGHPDVSH